ncbi:MAG: hypothetical protein H0T80_15980 [Betaproteobacteria bacterium]|nr:hypothetical protein [Betaproteobacteria bacterium]
MPTQLAFSTLSCGPNGSVAHVAAAFASRRGCTHTSPTGTPSTRSIVAPAARPLDIRRSGKREKFGTRTSLATRVEAAFAVAVLIGLAAIEGYFIAHAALSLQTPPESRAVAAAAFAAPPASERAQFSPQSSRLAMLVTVGSYVAAGLGGGR